MEMIGKSFPLERLRGEKGPLKIEGQPYTVVYFYPKDDTPGCTVEAKEFEELRPRFRENGIRIVGVSADDAASHRAFCDKYGLAFELATDEGGAVSREFGIWGGSNPKRETVVLDGNGNIIQHYPGVKPQGHARAILDDLLRLSREAPQG